jgi:hypothetical protein
MTIIAISGKKRVGKDTFGDLLVNKYGFTKVALADPLRNLCARVFYLDPDLFVNDNKKDAPMRRISLDFHDIDAIRNIVENEWGYEISQEAREKMEEFHGVDFDTPRDILRFVGTKLLRNIVSDDIWIELIAEKIKTLGGKVVITDCRFENEREFFRKMGAVLCLIKRNDNGEMAEHEFNLGSDEEYDVIFNNDSTLHSYTSSLDMWYNTKKNEFEYYKVWKYE